MAKDELEKADEAEAEDDAASFPLLPVEMREEGEESADAGDGLEIDDRQSEEMRRIFGTTLPQYLLPVEEMVQQLLSGQTSAETLPALLGTLTSLGSAASRMGFTEVVTALERMAEAVGALNDQPFESIPREVRETIVARLLDLRDLATEMGGEPAEEGASLTLFKALADRTDLDPSVLPRLSAAGLITVDQVLQADSGEVAAVTGLDRGTVDRICGILAENKPGEGDDEDGDKVLDLPLDEEALQKVLLRKLSQQVDAEAAVQEMRAEIRQLRTQVKRQRAELQGAEERGDRAAATLKEATEQVATRLAELGRVRASCEELAGRYAVTSDGLRHEEQRVVELQRARRDLARREARMDEEVEHLVDNVGRVLRRVARGTRARDRQAGDESKR
jgi:hypothetical protein